MQQTSTTSMPAYTVSALNEEVTELIKDGFGKIKVKGEMTNCGVSRGHLWFSLTDANASLKAVMWKSNYAKLNFNPEDGDSVVVEGTLGIYSKSGSYQLYVNKMEKRGMGELAREYQVLKNRLEQEGYFAPDKKKEMPRIVRKIGLITAEGGAALQDILYVFEQQGVTGDIVVKNCQVQGTNCAKSVVRSLQELDGQDFDVLVVTRGGGSFEDLFGFSHESVVKAIDACQTCVVSAIGHEVDWMLSDFVADIRAPTPSVAGQMIAQRQQLLILELDNLKNGIHDMLQGKLAQMKELVKEHQELLISPEEQKKQLLLMLVTVSADLNHKMVCKMSSYKQRLEKWQLKFEHMKPKRTGNATLLDLDGNPITTVNYFNKKKLYKGLRLILEDGEIEVGVRQIFPTAPVSEQ